MVDMASLLRPKALRTGDLVAVVATSGGLEKDEAPLYERGVDVLEQLGFVVRVSPLIDLDRSWWWAAAPPAEVAEDLNRHLRDPEVRAIFSLTGGRTTLSYLDLIDVKAVRADPKPVLGMSDISTLHLGSTPGPDWSPCTPTSSRSASGSGTRSTTPAASNSQTCIAAS